MSRPKPMRGHRRNSGLTLIELLVALVILSTLALLLSGSTRGLRLALQGILSREQRIGDPEIRLRLLSRDVESACDPGLAETPALTLRTGAETDPEFQVMSFFAHRAEDGSDDPARFEFLRIRYVVRRDDNGLSLWRAEQPVRDTGSTEFSREDRVLERLRSLQIQVFDGEAWASDWPVEGRDALPRRVRFQWLARGEAEAERTAEVWIPASLTVRPTVLRAVQP